MLQHLSKTVGAAPLPLLRQETPKRQQEHVCKTKEAEPAQLLSYRQRDHRIVRQVSVPLFF
jgi:hypothetical protein